MNDRPGNDRFGARLRARLAARSSARALGIVSASGAVDWWSSTQLLEHADAAARGFAARGIAPGDVGVLVAVDPRMAALGVLGLLFAGGVPLLVAPPSIQGVHSSLRATLLDVAQRTDARVVVVPPAEDVAGELRRTCPHAWVEQDTEALFRGTAIAAAPPSRRANAFEAAEPRLLQLTSGTTGAPRIVVWREAQVELALDRMALGMGLDDDDVFVNWTPLYHDMGLVNNLLLCLWRGLPLALLSPLDVVRRPGRWLKAMHTTGATTTWSPNFGYALAAERVRDKDLEGLDLSRVRGFWNAAERVHPDTLRRFHERFAGCGVRRESLRTNFGCVETIGGVTFTPGASTVRIEHVPWETLPPATRDVAGEAAQPRGSDVVSCGAPYPELELLILDDDDRPLPDGRIGRVAFRGGACFEEYLGEPEATQAARARGMVRTGDLGYRRNGELFWTGRLSERINLQGRKLDPSELERPLLAIPELRKGSFAAFGRANPVRGTEELVVLCEIAEESEAYDEQEFEALATTVRREVSMALGVTVEELALLAKGSLTKTSSGKRRHLHFRQLYEAGSLEVAHRSRSGL